MKWFEGAGVKYGLHDYKIAGIDRKRLESWIEQVGLETIFNKRSTTWKALTPSEQAASATVPGAIGIMVQHNSIIKRPVIEKNGRVIAVGFDEKKYREIFSK
jgi:Spx/MgsR family transcriptional regulator